jgi:hypothetical protein
MVQLEMALKITVKISRIVVEGVNLVHSIFIYQSK